MSIKSMLWIFFVSGAHATELRCGSLEVQPCRVKHNAYEREGFTCYNSEEQECIDRRAWCNIGRWYLDGDRCNFSENLMLENCLSAEKTINGKKYLLNMAEVDWTVAEQYCQSRKLNLVSFISQDEYDKVISFLQSVAKNRRNLNILKNVKTTDKLGQRCWPTERFNIYWTGLTFDRYDSYWRYTDGQTVNTHIATKEETLSDALQRHSVSTHLGHVGIVDQNFRFIMDDLDEEHRRIDSVSNRAKILCSDGENRWWSSGVAKRNSGCITGFKCSGRRPKCITGRSFVNSDVCNGVVDCPRGEDESDGYCPIFSARFPDNYRIATFYPFRRSPEVARQICRFHNLTLPSIQHNDDLKFMSYLPTLFAANRREPDFILSSQNWRNLSWIMLLGVDVSSNTWDDGSPIRYFRKEINSLGSAQNIYLRFDGLTKFGNPQAVVDRDDGVFPVCQEKSKKIIPFPVIIPAPTKGTAVLKPVWPVSCKSITLALIFQRFFLT